MASRFGIGTRMSFVARLLNKVAVLACGSCEGASGLLFDGAAGTVRVCPDCRGTGESSGAEQQRNHLTLPSDDYFDPEDRRAA